jgi:hypothetical protein
MLPIAPPNQERLARVWLWLFSRQGLMEHRWGVLAENCVTLIPEGDFKKGEMTAGAQPPSSTCSS